MLTEKIVVGALATNCYIIAPGANREAAVIDPGANTSLILEKLQEHNLKLVSVINTHGHYDHTGADGELAGHTGVPIYIGTQDADMLNDAFTNLSAFLGVESNEVEHVNTLKEGDMLRVGELVLQVIETPGHTKGSITILVENRLFTGDLLFKGSVGRTDFPGSSYETLLESLQKISRLSDDTVICPGHGPNTTLGEEKLSNMFFQEIKSEDGR